MLFSSSALPPLRFLPSTFSEFRALSRDQPSLLALSPSFVNPLCITCAHTYCPCLRLSRSFSHCSLSLRRRMSPTFESIARFRARYPPSLPFCSPRAHSSICPCSSPFSTFSFTTFSSTFSATLSTLPSDLLYHIRHQHYTRALISSVGNSAFLAISLLLCHPLAPSPTLSPPTPPLPRAPPRFLRLSIPTSPAHRIVYALHG